MREIATRITIEAFLGMEARNKELKSPEAAGFYMEIENRGLMKVNEAIWTDTRFLYLGTTIQGYHRRLRYFSHAVLARL